MAAKRSTLSLSQSGLSLARFLFAGEASLRGVRSDTNRRDTTSIQKRANQRRPVDSMNTRVAQPSPRWRQRQKTRKNRKKISIGRQATCATQWYTRGRLHTHITTPLDQLEKSSGGPIKSNFPSRFDPTLPARQTLTANNRNKWPHTAGWWRHL